MAVFERSRGSGKKSHAKAQRRQVSRRTVLLTLLFAPSRLCMRPFLLRTVTFFCLCSLRAYVFQFLPRSNLPDRVAQLQRKKVRVIATPPTRPTRSQAPAWERTAPEALPHLHFWPKACFHRSLGQRPRNVIPNLIWPKAILTPRHCWLVNKTFGLK